MNPRARIRTLDFTAGTYARGAVEIGILVGSFGLFAFLYFLFIQVAPIVSIREVREGEQLESGSGGAVPPPVPRPSGGGRSVAGADRRRHAVFSFPEDTRAALARMADGGIGATEIEVRSSIPLHGVLPAGQRLRTRVPLMAVLGGVAGGVGGFLLTSLTSQAYPLPTGGMPIVALPPAGVIAFEALAIGAILSTVATVFFECGLPGWKPRSGPLDRQLAVGRIVVTAPFGDAASDDWASTALATELAG